MIKTQNLTPDVYYKRSRDFQLLGRVYDVVFNYLRVNEELIQNAPLSNNFDTKLIDLVANTLGFKEAHDYNVKQLKALCSIFTLALRNKGNLQSIEMVLKMLANTENVNEECCVEQDTTDPYKLNVYIPSEIADLTLFEDVLTYILPAGVTCDIIPQEAVKTINETVIPFGETSVSITSYNPRQVGTGTVFEASQAEKSDLQKLFGNLTNTTVLKVWSAGSGNSTESEELAKLNDIKKKGE